MPENPAFLEAVYMYPLGDVTVFSSLQLLAGQHVLSKSARMPTQSQIHRGLGRV